ncbi:MAG: hypothetical protein F4Y58_02580 [Gammaproteobacteria bacterium]|nr:hypothetical protein [Gammaproteobacteria bacterium]
MTTGTDNMGFMANNQKCVLMAITDGGPYDNSGINGRIDALFAMGTELQSRSQGLQCAAFYPNVGQTELFFELDGIGFDANGFAITQDGNPLTVGSATRINPDAMEGVDPVVKVVLSTEIVSDADIEVTYTAAGEEPSVTMCAANFEEDTDEDMIADIADKDPFDPTDMETNPNAGSPVGNDVLFVESDVPFYSRSVVVRSLLRGEAFDYIEDEDGKPTPMTHTPTMTPAQYFGVAADARIYEYSMMCEDILKAAQANGLSQVKIGEFCTEDITNDFVNVINNDFVEDGSDGHRYLWATVRNGFLVSSYIGEEVTILPEINFLGQDTYLFVGPTSKTVVISAYVGDSTERVNIPVKGASQDAESDFSETDNDVHLEIPTRPKDEGTILTEYDITSHGAHPQPGETITRWLSGSSSIWQPMEETLAPVEGGIDPRNYMYAIGTHNHIDIRVADPETDAPITEIRQVLLYEVTDSDPPIRRVTSMVAKGTYYVAVDFDTNIKNIEDEVVVAAQHIGDLYKDITDDMMTTATQHIATVRETDFEKEELAIIVIEVDGDVNTTSVITVGWNKVGSVNNVISRYLVTTGGTQGYASVDADLDGIPDDHDRHINDNNRLQISLGGNPIVPDEHFLTTQDDNPTFLTYEGIVIADALNSDGGIKAINYSVVNNGDLDGDTQLLLDITINNKEGGDEIDTIATFGVAGVEYGFEPEGNGFKPTGGVVYASFPLVVVDPSLIGETLYLGKYNYDAERWVRFERVRSDYVDTWYAIDRPTGACPTDVQVYQNEHQAAGDGNGFIAGPTGNCLMLVLTDGGPYDSSGLDSRVLDPLSVGTKEFDTYREEQRRRGGGGGGAIGVSDILLLIGALVLITLASRKRRKTY